MAEKLEDEIKAAGGSIEFIEGNFGKLPIPEEEFDHITITNYFNTPRVGNIMYFAAGMNRFEVIKKIQIHDKQKHNIDNYDSHKLQEVRKRIENYA